MCVTLLISFHTVSCYLFPPLAFTWSWLSQQKTKINHFECLQAVQIICSSNLALQYFRKCFGNPVTTVFPGLVMLIMIITGPVQSTERWWWQYWPVEPDPGPLTTDTALTQDTWSPGSHVTPRQSFKLLTLVSQRSVTLVLWHMSLWQSWLTILTEGCCANWCNLLTTKTF